MQLEKVCCDGFHALPLSVVSTSDKSCEYLTSDLPYLRIRETLGSDSAKHFSLFLRSIEVSETDLSAELGP